MSILLIVDIIPCIFHCDETCTVHVRECNLNRWVPARAISETLVSYSVFYPARCFWVMIVSSGCYNKYHRHWLKQQKLISHRFGEQKSKNKVPDNSVPGESSHPGLLMNLFLLCPHMVETRMKEKFSLVSSCKDLSWPWWLHPQDLITSESPHLPGDFQYINFQYINFGEVWHWPLEHGNNVGDD